MDCVRILNMVVTKRTISVGVPRLLMWLFFHWRYFIGKTPWDTSVTPPEVVELIEREKFPPGRALDIGCGTGTNAIYLAQHGFQVVGVDFVTRALNEARAKAQAKNVRVEFRESDVMALRTFDRPFHFVLDIGCFHSLDPYGRIRYADNSLRWTQQGSIVMMYVFFPRKMFGRSMGAAREEMEKLFGADYTLLQYADDDKSAWYRWERK